MNYGILPIDHCCPHCGARQSWDPMPKPEEPTRTAKGKAGNMGCGLDQTGRTCDNGTCRIYNVDMPNIIAAREELVPVGERERNIAGDLNDFAWMDEVDGGDGAIFFAAGVFHYFTEAQARALINELAMRFPGCRIVFDVVGRLGKMLVVDVNELLRQRYGDDFVAWRREAVSGIDFLNGLAGGCGVGKGDLGVRDIAKPDMSPILFDVSR